MGIHKSILFLLFIPVAVCMAAEPTEYYGEKYLNRFAVFEKQDQFLKRLDNYDISKHFGQFLVGVFGDNYRKIDFYLKVVKDPSKPNFYVANGKNRLDKNIRPISGYIQITRVSKPIYSPYVPHEERFKNKSLHILVCRYEFKEPGDAVGDGVFWGYVSIIDYFDLDTQKPNSVNFVSDYVDFVKMFVGNWKNYETEEIKKCIFSTDVCCVHELPYCRDFYYYPKDEFNEGGFPRIRPEYDHYDWRSIDRDWVNE